MDRKMSRLRVPDLAAAVPPDLRRVRPPASSRDQLLLRHDPLLARRAKKHTVGTKRSRCISTALTGSPRTSLLLPYNVSTAPTRAKWTHKNVTAWKVQARACGGAGSHHQLVPTTPPELETKRRPTRCSDYAAAEHAGGHEFAGVRLFVGVMTGPSNRERRDAIRQTWMKWPTVGRSAVVCFVVGRRQVPNATLARLDAEAAEHGDLLFLPIADGCVKQVSIGKMHAFWLAAARLHSRLLPAPAADAAADVSSRAARPKASAAPLVVKVDDDSLVHLPLLEASLEPVRCLRRLYYGAVGFTGYQPLGFKNCGFAWSGGAAYERYGCAATGAHPAFPFVLGQLQVLTSPLISPLLPTSPHLRDLRRPPLTNAGALAAARRRARRERRRCRDGGCGRGGPRHPRQRGQRPRAHAQARLLLIASDCF